MRRDAKLSLDHQESGQVRRDLQRPSTREFHARINVGEQGSSWIDGGLQAEIDGGVKILRESVAAYQQKFELI